MKKWHLLAGLVIPVTFIAGISFAELAPTPPKHLTAFVTGEVTIADNTDSYTSKLIRFEDSEYKVVCYMDTKRPGLSCVKK